MKKILLFLVIVFSIFSICDINVEAKGFEVQRKFDNTTKINYLDDKGDYANCNGLLTADAVDMIRELLGYFRILAPAALILYVAVDFGSAVISQDNDALKKAQSKVVSRTIACALLFFVPTIVRALLGLKGVRDIISDDPLCGTMNSYPTIVIKDSN